jgi:hypothetical protein
MFARCHATNYDTSSEHTVCMSILRSHYLSTYFSLVRPPFTSDPFPSSGTYSSSAAPVRQPWNDEKHPNSSPSNESPVGDVFKLRGRETEVFDRFIARRIGDDLRKMESDLCQGGDEDYDIFTRLQVRFVLVLSPSELSPTNDRYTSAAASQM